MGISETGYNCTDEESNPLCNFACIINESHELLWTKYRKFIVIDPQRIPNYNPDVLMSSTLLDARSIMEAIRTGDLELEPESDL